MMKIRRWFKREQPISLKWKWGVLLFLGFFVIALTTLNFNYYYYHQEQRSAIKAVYQENFDRMTEYIQAFDYLYQRSSSTDLDNKPLNSNQQSQNISKELYQYISTGLNEDLTIRLFNERNQLIFSNRHLDVPTVESNKQLVETEIKDVLSYVGRTTIRSTQSGQNLGVLEYIVQPQALIELEKNQRHIFFISVLVLLLIAALVAFVLSRLFLRPLNYLNNALDLVEEENLSEMRMRRPRSTDEWSDLTLHINRMLDKIDLYVRNQKQFVEDVSHELRTPVAIVEGHLKLLNRWGKDDPEILEESISASLQEISRMKGLVQEMLDLMRADHAEMDYKDEITEVYSTIRQIHSNFVMLYPEFNFYLDSEKNPDDLYIKMFRNHFEQLLIILIDNAVKYSQDRKEIHLSVSTSLSEIEIAVQDFGEGMSEEDKERVFSRFYRVDKARSRDKGGNGLGLSIAQQLVKSYKGSIKVESALGHGSIFYVTFPILTDQRQIYKSKQKAIRKTL